MTVVAQKDRFETLEMSKMLDVTEQDWAEARDNLATLTENDLSKMQEFFNRGSQIIQIELLKRQSAY